MAPTLVVLRDEQSLSDSAVGISAAVDYQETYQGNGVKYTLTHLSQHNVKDELFVVQKTLDSGEENVYVCFSLNDNPEGGREEFNFLFGNDDMYLASIFQDDVEFVGIHNMNCQVDSSVLPDEVPGFVTEYRAEDVENPCVFVFETIDPNDADSYITFVQGVQVQKKEVEFLC